MISAPPFGGQPLPKNLNFFFRPKFLELCRSPVSKTLYSGPSGGPLAISLSQLGVMGCLGDFGDFFAFWGFFKSYWRPHLYTWRPHFTFVRYLGLSGTMFVPDTFWLRATVLELWAPKS